MSRHCQRMSAVLVFCSVCVCVCVCVGVVSKCVCESLRVYCSLRAEEIRVHMQNTHVNHQYICIVFVFSEPGFIFAREYRVYGRYFGVQ